MRRFLFLAFLSGSSLLGAGITMEPQQLRVGETVEITVTLEGSFATRSSLRLPLTTNLVVEQGPSVSTTFRWINGRSSRTRTFRYIARARREGIGTVGPIDMADQDGEAIRLPAARVEILPAASPQSNDPALALEQSRATGGVFVTVRIDQSEAFLGEQVNITWTMYSRDPLRGFRLTSVPVLDSFWTEEVPQPRQETEQVIVNGEMLHKAVVRRIAIFPLRTGKLEIGPLEVLAEVMEADNFFGNWGFLERRVEDYRARSGPVALEVKSVPAGAETVGEFTLQCGSPAVPRKGPVTFDVTLSGTGNVRAVDAPTIENASSAAVEVQARPTVVNRGSQPVRMTRSWRYLIFPQSQGRVEIPTVSIDYFDPANAQIETLRCGGGQVAVSAGNVGTPGGTLTSAAVPRRRGASPKSNRVTAPFAIGVAALVAFAAVYARAVLRHQDAPLVESLWQNRNEPREMRRLLFDTVNEAGLRPAELFTQESNLGDTFRSLHSIIDVMEKEPWELDSLHPELKKRARDFHRELRKFN